MTHEGFQGDPKGGAAYGEFTDIGSALALAGPVIGGIMGSNAQEDAAQTQANAAIQQAKIAQETQQQTNQMNMGIYNQNRTDTEPWRTAGGTAVGQLSQGTQTGGDFNKPFSYTMADFQADPGYQFSLNQATKALQNQASASGTLNSGGFSKALTDYTLGAASQEYGNVYNRAYNQFNTDTSNRFNRLSTIAGLGNGANSLTTAAGTSAAGTSAGANIASANMQTQAAAGYGNAVSAGQIGGANSIIGGMGSALNQYNRGNALANINGGGVYTNNWQSDVANTPGFEPTASSDMGAFNNYYSQYGG